MDEVMTEFFRGLDLGYTNIALLGTDIGDYGKDIGLDFIDLLRKMVDVPRPFNLRLRNVNPRWIAARWQDFCEVAETGKITYMQVALQSGSDRVLALMRRGHQIGELMDALAEIRGRAPRLVLRTQLIAGFPRESDWDFRQSMAVVKSGVFDYTDVFRYTPRPGTAAAEIEPEVPWDVIMRRYRALFFETTVRHPVRTMSAVRRMRSAPLRSRSDLALERAAVIKGAGDRRCSTPLARSLEPCVAAPRSSSSRPAVGLGDRRQAT